jgi:PD-(D/E)XK nuclease superfamily
MNLFQNKSEPMKPFQWSWSKIKNYRSCPKRHFEIDISKSFKEPDSEPLRWGNTVHKAMEEFIGKGKPLPATVARYHQWPENILKLKPYTDIKVEQQMAFGRDFGPTNYFAADTWCRVRIDVLVLIPQFKAALTIDWKTGGNVSPDMEQLGISAQAIFAHHPEVDEVATLFVWLGHGTQTIKTYKRDKMAEMWNGLWPILLEMDEAWRTTTYPAKPSGLCKNHCPVSSCPYHGKGNR